MNLKSKIYIGIIIFSLAVIAAVLSARRIQSVWFPPDKSAESETVDEEGYYPFAEGSGTLPEDSSQLPNRMMIAVEGEDAYVPEKQMQKPFFGGQIDLPALAKEQEAYINSGAAKKALIDQEEFKNKEELQADFEVYAQDPLLKQFVADMQKAMGEDMLNRPISPEEMTEKILNNPQMQKILLQYSKNPKLMQMADEAFRKAQASQNAAAAAKSK
ncbi:MAG: hypothetical protein ACI352_00165 [Elusimicrobiaceae bacterium]